MIKFLTFETKKTAFEGLKEGLKELGLLELIKENNAAFKKELCGNGTCDVKGEELFNMYTKVHSEDESHLQKEKECFEWLKKYFQAREGENP